MGTDYFKTVKLISIATIERTKSDKIYPKETIYIRVSACKRKGGWEMLAQDSHLGGEYATIEWKIPINAAYMFEALSRSLEHWKHKYVGTNINIQMEVFKYYTLQYHPDIEVQNKLGEAFEKVNLAQELEKKYIEHLKELKKFHLQGMFPK